MSERHDEAWGLSVQGKFEPRIHARSPGSCSKYVAASSPSCFTFAVSLPYKIATLIYCFNERDDVLLMERAQEPNLGLWSPPGGKLQQHTGESPHACAAREASEEIGITPRHEELHLTGIVSEHGYAGHAHWLMFLFELKKRINSTPPTISEGRFQFFSRDELNDLTLPQTDREMVWPLFWRHRGQFFTAHCRCGNNGANEWTLEQSSAP